MRTMSADRQLNYRRSLVRLKLDDRSHQVTIRVPDHHELPCLGEGVRAV